MRQCGNGNPDLIGLQEMTKPGHCAGFFCGRGMVRARAGNTANSQHVANRPMQDILPRARGDNFIPDKLSGLIGGSPMRGRGSALSMLNSFPLIGLAHARAGGPTPSNDVRASSRPRAPGWITF